MFSLKPVPLPIVVNLPSFPLQVVTWLTRLVSGYKIRGGVHLLQCLYWYHLHTDSEEELGGLNMLVLCNVHVCLELEEKYIIQDTDWFMQGLVAMAESPLLLIFFWW